MATGGSYLGICMGAYLAGSEGFGFFSESVGGGGRWAFLPRVRLSGRAVM